MNFDKELSTRGLECPLPVLQTRKAMKSMESGQVLKMISTDSKAMKDMEEFSRQTGFPLLSAVEENNECVFYIQKK